MNKHLEQARLQVRKTLAPAIEWYQQREEREQRVLQVLAALLVAAVVYWLIWQPSWQARESARSRYLANQETLAWIEGNADVVRKAQAGSDSGGDDFGANWVSEISRDAQSYGLTLRGFTPEGDRAVRVQMENQPASAMLIWLHELEQRGLDLSTMEMSAGDEPGTASLRATLNR